MVYVKNSTLARRLELLFQYFVYFYFLVGLLCSALLLLLPAEVCSELRMGPNLNPSLNQKQKLTLKLPEPRGELNETATLTVRCQLPWPKAEWAWPKAKGKAAGWRSGLPGGENRFRTQSNTNLFLYKNSKIYI